MEVYKSTLRLFSMKKIRQCVRSSGGGVIGLSNKKEIYRRILCFMIVGVKENSHYTIKATPVARQYK